MQQGLLSGGFGAVSGQKANCPAARRERTSTACSDEIAELEGSSPPPPFLPAPRGPEPFLKHLEDAPGAASQAAKSAAGGPDGVAARGCSRQRAAPARRRLGGPPARRQRGTGTRPAVLMQGRSQGVAGANAGRTNEPLSGGARGE